MLVGQSAVLHKLAAGKDQNQSATDQYYAQNSVLITDFRQIRLSVGTKKFCCRLTEVIASQGANGSDVPAILLCWSVRLVRSVISKTPF